MTEIPVASWNGMSKEEKCRLYANGFKWRTDWNILNYGGGTAYVNAPPGYRYEGPAGGSFTYYSPDGMKFTSLDAAWNDYCTTPPGCRPVWQCELPLNGYEKDGCGNRRQNSACAPPKDTPPPGGCTDGATRTVKCPRDASRTVLQKCVSGTWVTVPADEKTCKEEKNDLGKVIIAAMILALVLVFLGSGE